MRLLLFTAAFTVLVFTGCTELQQPSPDSGGEAVELPEQELYEATITFYKDDKLSTILKAGRIRKYQQSQIVMMDSGIVVDFFNELGKHATTLWADSGNANERTQNLLASGHVVAVSDSGGKTGNLRAALGSYHSPHHFGRSRENLYSHGYNFRLRFVSDQNLKNWTIERPEGITFRDLSKESIGPSSPADTTLPMVDDSAASDSSQ